MLINEALPPQVEVFPAGRAESWLTAERVDRGAAEHIWRREERVRD